MFTEILVCVNSSFICNNQLETIHMSTYGWMDKQIMAHPLNKIILSNEKEWATDTCKQHEWLSQALSLVKEDRPKHHIVYLYGILIKAKLYEQKSHQQLPGARGRRGDDWPQMGTKEIVEVKKILHIFIRTVVTCLHSYLFK